MTSLTVLRECAVCHNTDMPGNANTRNCRQCGALDAEAYKTVARYKKAVKLHVFLEGVLASGPEIASLPDFARRLVETSAGVPECSQATWALVAYMAGTVIIP